MSEADATPHPGSTNPVAAQLGMLERAFGAAE
jgi:hypothetical protein